MGYILSWNGYTLNLDRRTHLMGVLNVTPDSFSDGGRFFSTDRAVSQGLALARDGADIIDVGGESTRPYSERLSADEELSRILPVIRALRQALDIPISIDTYKAVVAQEAINAGASIINDISALTFDSQMGSVAAGAGVPVILMHMKGTPGSMQDNPRYGDLIREIIDFLKDGIRRCESAGISRDRIIVDPGVGFGKTFDHNLCIINRLKAFQALDLPLLVGSSNKAFIGKILDREAHERDVGTMATVAVSAMNGAHIIRVHNIKMALETVKIIDAIKRECITGN